MSKSNPEFKFLAAGDLDKLAALVFELSSQLHVERHKRLALEQALVAKGVLARSDIDALAEDKSFLDAARAEADTSLRKLLRILAEAGDRQGPLRAEAP